MDKHTLRVLEYRKVLDLLASHTATTMGREVSLGLAPAIYPEIVERRLQETREARLLLDQDSGMPLGGIRDVREAVERAGIGAVLVPLELLDVSSTVASARRLKAYLQKRFERCPLLAEIAGNLPVPPNIETKIDEAIADGGEVRDSATPELARVRSELKSIQARLRDRLNSILASERYRPYIQESVITIREGRYCIPVKAENRSQFGGIVHDASASGATVFVEPGPCVEMGNEVKELSIKEDQEVFRILTRLTEMVGRSAADIRSMLELLANLDMVNAKALLASEMQAAEPHLNRRGVVRLYSARHPLLHGHVVPIDVEVGDRFTILLITGPNTGGKTVTLKTIALLTLMTQSGLQIPASPDSDVAIFEQVFADIGDEQDIQQSLSTFSAHLKNITRIVAALSAAAEEPRSRGAEEPTPYALHPTPSLVVLDEIGAGTDPAEGAALAKALIETLRAAGARVVATTHYGELKEFAFSQPGIENASVEFNRETLQPTYHVLLGVPGSSNAFYISERLGLQPRIVERAREYLTSREQSSAEILRQIEESRRSAFEMERQAQEAKRAAEAARDEFEERARQVADVQRSVRRQAEEEARTILRKAADRAENIIGELRLANRGQRKGATARRQLADVRREVATQLETPEPEPVEAPPPEGYRFHRGDRVRVTTLGLDGDVLEEPSDGVAVVQMGSMRATLPLDVLRPAPALAAARSNRSASDIAMRKAIHISPEINLRAMRVDEASPLLDKYMDDAFAAGMKQVRIVHGKGTGALRKFVWEYLKEHPVVGSLRLGEEGEGGEGATVVTFKE